MVCARVGAGAEALRQQVTNALTVLVPLSLILMGYRYGYLSFELSFILAGLFLAAVIALAVNDRQ
jgi:hypothetical protein